jgi:hypothetical protein
MTQYRKNTDTDPKTSPFIKVIADYGYLVELDGAVSVKITCP